MISTCGCITRPIPRRVRSCDDHSPHVWPDPRDRDCTPRGSAAGRARQRLTLALLLLDAPQGKPASGSLGRRTVNSVAFTIAIGITGSDGIRAGRLLVGDDALQTRGSPRIRINRPIIYRSIYVYLYLSISINPYRHTHARARACTHARTHARTDRKT